MDGISSGKTQANFLRSCEANERSGVLVSCYWEEGKDHFFVVLVLMVRG